MWLMNKAFSAVTSTSVGKEWAVKPLLRSRIEEKRKPIVELEEIALDPRIKADEELSQTLKATVKASDTILNEIKKDAVLNPICDIIGDQAGEKGIEEMRVLIKESQAMKNLRRLVYGLVDVQNCVDLFKQFEKIQSIEKSGSPEEKVAFVEELEAKILQLVEETNQVNVDQFKQDVEKAVRDLCLELNVEQKKADPLLALFDGLTKQHLPTFNQVRKDLAVQVPAFIGNQKRKLLELDNAEEQGPAKKARLGGK